MFLTILIHTWAMCQANSNWRRISTNYKITMTTLALLIQLICSNKFKKTIISLQILNQSLTLLIKLESCTIAASMMKQSIKIITSLKCTQPSNQVIQRTSMIWIHFTLIQVKVLQLLTLWKRKTMKQWFLLQIKIRAELKRMWGIKEETIFRMSWTIFLTRALKINRKWQTWWTEALCAKLKAKKIRWTIIQILLMSIMILSLDLLLMGLNKLRGGNILAKITMMMNWMSDLSKI